MFANQTIKESTSTNKFNKSSMSPLTLLVSLATFNIRGLGNEINYIELNSDCDNFHCDIISLQETKVVNSFEQVFRDSGNKLIMVFNQIDVSVTRKNGKEQINLIYQRGIGFMISKRMLPGIKSLIRLVILM